VSLFLKTLPPIPELSEFEIRQMLLIHKKLYLATNKGIIEFNKDSINQFMKDVAFVYNNHKNQ
jgi:hypothetical protein